MDPLDFNLVCGEEWSVSGEGAVTMTTDKASPAQARPPVSGYYWLAFSCNQTSVLVDSWTVAVMTRVWAAETLALSLKGNRKIYSEVTLAVLRNDHQLERLSHHKC